MGRCYFCGMEFDSPVYRTTICTSCGKDLKICLNCKFYAPGSHYDCSETIREPVRDKERANFCDYFQAGSNFKGNASVKGKAEKGRDAFHKLFGE